MSSAWDEGRAAPGSVMGHAARCASCGEFAARWGRIEGELREGAMETAEAEAGVSSGAPRLRLGFRYAGLGVRGRWILAAAVLLLVIGVAFWQWDGGQVESGPGARQVAVATVAEPLGEVAAVLRFSGAMADGSAAVFDEMAAGAMGLEVEYARQELASVAAALASYVPRLGAGGAEAKVF